MSGTLTLYTETEDGSELVAPIWIYDFDQNNLLIEKGSGTKSNPWVIQLPPSHYIINFLPVDGWDDPPSPDVWVTEGGEQTVVGVYTPAPTGEYAQIEVFTDPVVGPIYCDGSRYGQGYVPIIKYPPIDGQDYVISFGDVSNYITPANQVVTLYPGDHKVITGTYVLRTIPAGYLTVHTTLNNEAPMHAEVFLNGVSIGYGDGDIEAMELDPGTYVISFMPLNGWTMPADVTVTIQEGQTTEVTGNYQIIIAPGTIIVDTEPVSGDIFIDGVFIGTGHIEWRVSSGNHVVSFGEVTGYDKPKNTTVNVISYAEVTVTGTYVESTTPVLGMLTVSTSPVSGDIFVNNEFVGVGVINLELDPGTYIVSFGEVSGYVKPNNITATVISGMTVNRIGYYTEIVVPPGEEEEGGFPWWLLLVAAGTVVVASRRKK